MLDLRQYQEQLLVDLRHSYKSGHRKVVMTLPTGGGKTAIMMSIARLWKQGQVVWMTHRVELAQQAHKQAELWGVPLGKMDVWTPMKLYNGLYRRDKETKRRVDCSEQAWKALGYCEKSLLIVDEMHHGASRTWGAIIDSFPGYVLGATATPWRMSKREGFDHLFDDIVSGPNMKMLINWGFLSPIRAWCVPNHDVRIRGLGSSGGEYNIGATERGIKQRSNEYAVSWCLDMLAEHDVEKRVIVFALSVRHAEAVAKCFRDWGVTAAALHSQMEKEDRQKVVDGFSNGEIEVVVNVQIATEGFDIPDARCVLMLRPTKSLALYLQMIGRATRVAPNKEFAMVLDATENVMEFGLPQDVDEAMEWSLEARGGGKSGEAPCKTCPRCSEQVSASALTCPACGYEFMKECDWCGRNKPLDRFEDEDETTCTECKEDFEEDFNNAREVHSIDVRWEYSLQKEKWYANKDVGGHKFLLLVMQSAYNEDRYGYLVIKDDDALGKWSFRSESSDRARQLAEKKMRNSILSA